MSRSLLTFAWKRFLVPLNCPAQVSLKRFLCRHCQQLFKQPPRQTPDGYRVCPDCYRNAGIPVAMNEDRAIWRELRQLLLVRCPGDGCQAVHRLAMIDRADGPVECPACRYRLRLGHQGSLAELRNLLLACRNMCDLVEQLHWLALAVELLEESPAQPRQPMEQ